MKYPLADANTNTPAPPISSALRDWVMTVLTAIFVLLYAAALLGWLKPLTDERMVAHLEPIIFVIIGYYFGRLPGQQVEQTLKGEMQRQTQKADAAQHAKEQALQAREALEEKIKNVRISLTSSATGGVTALSRTAIAGEAVTPNPVEPLQQRMALALDLLNS